MQTIGGGAYPSEQEGWQKLGEIRVKKTDEFALSPWYPVPQSIDLFGLYVYMENEATIMPGEMVIELANDEEATHLDLQSTYGIAQLHHNIREVSEKLFMDGYFAQAIFEAYKTVGNLVKQKSGRKDLDGQELMSKVFSYSDPIIKINELHSQSDRDEQMGFMFLFMGAMTGIRNPPAHDTIEQSDPIRAMEYLAFASLLARRVEEGIVNMS